MSEWRDTTIGEVLTLQRGIDITRAEQRPGIVPVVSSGGIASFHDTAAALGPGVVIGRKGSLGTAFYLDRDYWPHDTTLWVKNFKGNIPRYVYYFFLGLDVKGLDVGSANPTLNRNHVHPMPVRWPDRNTQAGVVAVLGALDDKIAVNNKIIFSCDKIRYLRLENWMRSSRDLLETRPLSEYAEFTNGRAFTKDASGTGRMVIRIAELNSGPGISTIYSGIDVSARHLAYPGTVLFAWSGSLVVARWYRPEAIINQHIFKVVPTVGVPGWLLYDILQSRLGYYKSIAEGKATTMGHIQRRHLDEPVEVPARASIGDLDAALRPLWERALNAERESLVLGKLRDALLPNLIAGRIRVRDVERIVEDAT